MGPPCAIILPPFMVIFPTEFIASPPIPAADWPPLDVNIPVLSAVIVKEAPALTSTPAAYPKPVIMLVFLRVRFTFVPAFIVSPLK